MKLADIRAAVEHATEAEFKRSFYNSCAVFERSFIEDLFGSLLVEVYESSEESANPV